MKSNGTTQTEKQHYVPKFLLRRFSYQENQKEIGVFNTNTDFFRYKCALRDQAYKHFLYGKDGTVEDILSKQIEGPSSSLIKNIIDSNAVPRADTDEFIKLLEFVIVSHLRTPKLGDRANASSDRLARVMLEHNKELSAIAEDYEFGFENPVVNNLEHIKSSVVSCLDLKLVLLINRTSVPFIISDNPLIKYNQFLETRNYSRGATGFGNLGLQMFIPVGPHHCIILHDQWIYKIGSRSNASVIETSVETDIEQLNLLAFLHCDKQVFFNECVSEAQIRKYFEKSKKYDKADTAKVYRFLKTISQRKGDDDNGFYHMTVHLPARIKMALSFISQTKQARKYYLDESKVQVRKTFEKVKHIVDKL